MRMNVIIPVYNCFPTRAWVNVYMCERIPECVNANVFTKVCLKNIWEILYMLGTSLIESCKLEAMFSHLPNI